MPFASSRAFVTFAVETAWLQGFASGDCERDAQAINIFMEDGHAMGCSQSYAKNMGLYGQRIGCFSIVTEDPKETAKVESQMKVCHHSRYHWLGPAFGMHAASAPLLQPLPIEWLQQCFLPHVHLIGGRMQRQAGRQTDGHTKLCQLVKDAW